MPEVKAMMRNICSSTCRREVTMRTTPTTVPL